VVELRAEPLSASGGTPTVTRPGRAADVTAGPGLRLTLRSGLELELRPILPSDKEELRHGFDRLSAVSRYRRFLAPMTRLPDDMVARFTEIDYVDHFAWVALDPRRGPEHGVGVARYIRLDDDPRSADVAVTVVDAYQGRGVGTLLLRLLCLTAHAHGVDRLTSLVLAENVPMRRLLSRLRARLGAESGGVFSVELDTAAVAAELAGGGCGERR
jgi:RimJ/RimL family protein N-acetyltransferase